MIESKLKAKKYKPGQLFRPCLSFSIGCYGQKNTRESNTMTVQRTANGNAAGLRRICKRSDQPKIERLENKDASRLLRIVPLSTFPYLLFFTV